MASELILVADDGSQLALRARPVAASQLLTAVGSATAGKLIAIATSSDLRTTRLLADWLASGALPVADEVALQQLYVLSARLRLDGLRDDIERCIAGSVPSETPMLSVGPDPGVEPFGDIAVTSRPALAMSSLAATATGPVAAGLTTPEYISGRWRDMYIPAPGSALAASQIIAPSCDEGFVDVRASFERRQRAAALTALPDPFGLARR